MKSHTTDKVTIEGREYFTRAWVMAASGREEGAERHHAFYSQFATPAVRKLVEKWANDPSVVEGYKGGDFHMNSVIYMKSLDNLQAITKTYVGHVYTQASYADTGNSVFWSLACNVCILKAAIRVIIEENEAKS